MAALLAASQRSGAAETAATTTTFGIRLKDEMLALGFVTGLGAALCQALSYLATRHYVQVRGGGVRQLLVLGHVIMGAISILFLPWIWPYQSHVGMSFYSPLVWCGIWSVLGQLGQTAALRYLEASRVSPLLSFKLVILAMLTVLLTTQPIKPIQWIAIALCICGGIALNYSDGAHARLSQRVISILTFAVLSYSLSDWNIQKMVMALSESTEKWRAYTCATLALYVFCGVIATGLLPFYGSKRRNDWQEAAPYAVAWLLAMLLLFACFGLVGVVFGNILQSTRGLMSLGIGVVSVRLGWHHIESATSRRVFTRRLLATLMMTGAVILYALGKVR